MNIHLKKKEKKTENAFSRLEFQMFHTHFYTIEASTYLRVKYIQNVLRCLNIEINGRSFHLHYLQLFFAACCFRKRRHFFNLSIKAYESYKQNEFSEFTKAKTMSLKTEKLLIDVHFAGNLRAMCVLTLIDTYKIFIHRSGLYVNVLEDKLFLPNPNKLH